MNCRRAEQWILLGPGGELPDRKRARLEAHLAACARCREYRADLQRLVAAARRGLPAGEPAPRTLAAIRAAARTELAAPTPAAWGWAAWRPALAAAAVLLLCLGGWFRLAGPPAPRTTAAAIESGDWQILFPDEEGALEQVSEPPLQAELSPLDRDLLLLENLAI